MRRVAERWRVPVAVPAALAVAASGFAAYPYGPVVSVPAAVAALAVLVPYRGVPAGAVTAVTVAVSLAASLLYRGPQAPIGVYCLVEVPALLVLIGRVVRREPPRGAAVLGAGLTAAMLGLSMRAAMRSPMPARVEALAVGSVLFLLLVACAVGVGLYLRGLDVRRVRAVAEARRSQRLALARDLHDFVAHEVTGIVLEAQAAQLRDLGTDESRGVQRRIEEAALRALDSMDETLRALRDPDDGPSGDLPPTRLYGLGDLPELVERFAGGGAPGAELAMDPALPGRLSREADGTAYRLVLEALTNVRRHARRATRVRVTVAAAAPAAVELRVRDDGGAGGHGGTAGLARVRRRAGGTGLAELDARVRAHGGTLTAGPDGDGWTVVCVLPTGRVRD
ncbi:sensor histidine kinase [Actinomadura algeriensis]|uniref:histidine kinase n=1 Tax=Actinomadura algeriensis TaxID=1679523 RepID=A0ABR9JJ82_9ACTN|nr:histidine kinase [Actinomadura algeriensis]MBE1530616.1 signal transduction histidine kinase [Actinomadura algeriensis]